MNNHWSSKFLKVILIVIVFIVSSLHLLEVISEPDFFWHLKTGEWIWQNKSLPSEDPFAYITPQIHTSREHFILTSYWLSQIIYYLLYLIGGIPGIVFLRFIVASILIYVMIKRKRGDSILYISLLIIFLTQFLEESYIDRPQVFSFLFFVILLYLLEKIKGNGKVNKRLKFIWLPFLMLAWANMHGGYILGQVTIIFYIVMEGVKFIHPSLGPVKKESYKRLFIAGVLAIIFSLANPNTYHAVVEMINIPAYMVSDNVEYQSSLEIFREILRAFRNHSIFLYWFILLLTIVALIMNLKRIDITEIALLAGTGFFSFTAMRYIPFFMIAALPVISRVFSEKDTLKWGRIFLILVGVYSAIFFTMDERFNITRIKSGRWLNNYFSPENAVEFILKNDLKGNMYNHYNYGGYLIWRLAPERKVFIDGRNISENVYIQSMLINSADEMNIAGLPAWKFTLNYYNVKYIVVPLFEHSGRILPLVYALIKDRDWIPVFFNLNSLIFVKDLPENYDVIMKYTIPKDYFKVYLSR